MSSADQSKSKSNDPSKTPSFEEWKADGCPLPSDRMWLGGTPWFDERGGRKRSEAEVYDMIYGQASSASASGTAEPNQSK